MGQGPLPQSPGSPRLTPYPAGLFDNVRQPWQIGPSEVPRFASQVESDVWCAAASHTRCQRVSTRRHSSHRQGTTAELERVQRVTNACLRWGLISGSPVLDEPHVHLELQKLCCSEHHIGASQADRIEDATERILANAISSRLDVATRLRSIGAEEVEVALALASQADRLVLWRVHRQEIIRPNRYVTHGMEGDDVYAKWLRDIRRTLERLENALLSICGGSGSIAHIWDRLSTGQVISSVYRISPTANETFNLGGSDALFELCELCQIQKGSGGYGVEDDDLEYRIQMKLLSLPHIFEEAT